MLVSQFLHHIAQIRAASYTQGEYPYVTITFEDRDGNKFELTTFAGIISALDLARMGHAINTALAPAEDAEVYREPAND